MLHSNILLCSFINIDWYHESRKMNQGKSFILLVSTCIFDIHFLYNLTLVFPSSNLIRHTLWQKKSLSYFFSFRCIRRILLLKFSRYPTISDKCSSCFLVLFQWTFWYIPIRLYCLIRKITKLRRKYQITFLLLNSFSYRFILHSYLFYDTLLTI